MRIVKILLITLLIAILAAASFTAYVWIRYKLITSEKPALMPAHLKSTHTAAAYVNPFIGTGGIYYLCGNNFPGASLPFGVMRLSPETSSMITGKRALNYSGYYYADPHIIGFSHTRLVGTGAVDGGHFLVFPTSANKIGHLKKNQRKQKFSHKNERAYPGYYSVHFKKPNIHAELTSSMRSGVHRYTFGSDIDPGLIIDISHAMGDRPSNGAQVVMHEDQRSFQGKVKTYGTFASRYGGIEVFFAAQFNRPFSKGGVWKDDQFEPGIKEATGDDLSIAFGFEEGQNIELKMAISHVSIENAWENLKAETGEKNFDDIAGEALERWEQQLGLARISGGSEEDKFNFYTALYRSFQMPSVFNDVNGEYKGFDKNIHKAEGFQYYTDMSLWDTFRTTHPLYTLLIPGAQLDMVKSFMKMAEQGGWLPRWPSGYGYTNSMLGTPADITITETYLKGIKEFDTLAAFQLMLNTARSIPPPGSAFSGRRGNDSCVLYDYCPSDSMTQAVSRTFEYGWSDYAISLFAEAMGFEEEARTFRKYARNYQHLWDAETRYFRPRKANGEFEEAFKPLLLTYLDSDGKYTNDYVEGSALQWKWAAFYDTKGKIDLLGGPEIFVEELNDFFEKADPAIGKYNPGPYYWHGNQPDIHAAYMFNDAGRPDLTQKWVRWILQNKYKNEAYGLDGNDDGGTLSAWHVLSALGIYPVAGSDEYHIGAPLFEKAVLTLPGGELTIEAKNYGANNMFVNKVVLNGLELDRTRIKHHEIASGGKLVFHMKHP
ncbi:MAG: GH92 family glycosyl hydrolase [Cyclobacteriaceae bacterium]|nr:GH92 family glycosyl hydrolase [Cyclobacteriaceae bacterium]